MVLQRTEIFLSTLVYKFSQSICFRDKVHNLISAHEC